MTAGQYIVAICALGALIAAAGFVWAVRTGQFKDWDDAKWLVFDDEDNVDRRPRTEDRVPRTGDR